MRKLHYTNALEGKVAVITGAGSGIGKATVEVFVQEGAICPGGVATNIGMGLSQPSKRGSSKVGIGMPLMSRMGDPIEIASTAVFLSCDDSTFINGTTITVDGGWSAY